MLQKFFLGCVRLIQWTRESGKKLKTNLIESYEHHSDPSNINEFMRNGFNFDLDLNIVSGQSLGHKFYCRLIMYLVLQLVYIYQGIGSVIFWEDKEMVLIVGNFMTGMKLPPALSVFPYVLGITLSISPFLWMSMAAITRNPNLIKSMEPIKTVAGTCASGADMNTAEQIRKELKPFIAPIRLLTNVIIPANFLTVVVGCFLAESFDYIYSWKVLITITWSLLFAVMSRQMYHCQGAVIITITVYWKLIQFSIAKMSSEWQTMDVNGSRVELWKQTHELVKLVTQLRRCNAVMRSSVGLTMAYYYFMSTVLTYFIINPTTPMALVIPAIFVVPAYFLMIALFDVIGTRIRRAINKKAGELLLKSAEMELDFADRTRLNLVCAGMNHRQTFDGSDFMPPLDSSLIVRVCSLIAVLQSNNVCHCSLCLKLLDTFFCSSPRLADHS